LSLLGDIQSQIQNQVQTQINTLLEKLSLGQVGLINVQSAGDPALERKIFGSVHSAGRQLGRICAVVELLLAQRAGDPAFAADPRERAAVQAFQEMQRDIQREKQARDPQRIIDALEHMRQVDPDAFRELLPRLSQWVKEVPPAETQAQTEPPPASATASA
jgi:hypothetical protein